MCGVSFNDRAMPSRRVARTIEVLLDGLGEICIVMSYGSSIGESNHRRRVCTMV